jgi:hypothetical protein
MSVRWSACRVLARLCVARWPKPQIGSAVGLRCWLAVVMICQATLLAR